MEAKGWEREEARRLRAEGLTLNAIAARLGVAKSSVSVWVRDIPGPPQHRKNRRRGRPTTPDPPFDPDEPVRHCSRCEQDLPESRFNRLREGRQWWCRDCFKEYFRERGDKHRAQSSAAKKRKRAPQVRFVRDYLAANPCVDCGEDDVLVLEFDHCRDEKVAEVSRLISNGASLDVVRAEVAKCDPVCANCHRRRTSGRARTFRATGVPRPSWQWWQTRNHQHLVDHLRHHGCIDCGETDPVVLEFDHVRDKRANVAQFAFACSLERLEAEIAKCVVRCANCHRLRTQIDRRCRGTVDHWALGLFDDHPNP